MQGVQDQLSPDTRGLWWAAETALLRLELAGELSSRAGERGALILADERPPDADLETWQRFMPVDLVREGAL